jgi:hypothetical protein
MENLALFLVSSGICVSQSSFPFSLYREEVCTKDLWTSDYHKPSSGAYRAWLRSESGLGDSPCMKKRDWVPENVPPISHLIPGPLPILPHSCQTVVLSPEDQVLRMSRMLDSKEGVSCRYSGFFLRQSWNRDPYENFSFG